METTPTTDFVTYVNAIGHFLKTRGEWHGKPGDKRWQARKKWYRVIMRACMTVACEHPYSDQLGKISAEAEKSIVWFFDGGRDFNNEWDLDTRPTAKDWFEVCARTADEHDAYSGVRAGPPRYDQAVYGRD
jgi:hypothetical protein